MSDRDPSTRSPGAQDRIEAAEAFLVTLYRKPREYLNAAGLKHDAERYIAGLTGQHQYISAADIVEPARRLGWSCQRPADEGPYRVRRNRLN